MKLELRAIRVINCGPLDDVRVEFYDEQGKTLKVCVLAGANGSGKTTLLEVITWIIQVITGSPSGNLSLKYAQLDMRVDNKDFSIALGDKPEDAVLPSEFVYLKWADNNRQNLIQSERGRLIDKLNEQATKQQNTRAELPGFAKPSVNGDWLPSILYFPHTRSLEVVNVEQIRKETLRYQFVHRFDVVRTFPGSLNSYLIWLDYAEPEQFKAAQKFLNELDFEGKTFHVQRKALDILVRTRDGHEHKLHELSSGEQNLLIILMELRRRLLPHSIVLIDEIENSLHPAYQHKLAQALLKMQQMIPFQLIVTTHSWEFAEIFGPSATRVLTKF